MITLKVTIDQGQETGLRAKVTATELNRLINYLRTMSNDEYQFEIDQLFGIKIKVENYGKNKND